MRLALRTHQLRWILPFELAVATFGGLLGSGFIYVPTLSGMGAVPVTMIAALAATVTLAFPINAAWPAARTTSVRRPAIVAASVLAMISVAVAAIAVLLGLMQVPAAYTYLGTFAWLLAMQLLVGILVSGTYQAMAPVIYVLLCALLGRSDSSVQPWAWPLADFSTAASLGLGAGALGIAMALFAVFGLHRGAIS